LATCGLFGFLGPAPGTVGALLGAIVYPIVFRPFPFWIFWPTYGILCLFAVRICGRAADALRRTDPPAVILDEFLAMALCYWPVEHFLKILPIPYWAFLLSGFVFFRVFDIYKPFFINTLQNLPGGWGIVVDDLAAALATAALSGIALFFIRH
jgi:phosphatidylglycerophosphatase A